jgi:hypothetical protein
VCSGRGSFECAARGVRVVRVGTGRPHECVAGNIDAPGKQSNALTVGLGAIVCCFDFGASVKSDRPIGYAQHRSVDGDHTTTLPHCFVAAEQRHRRAR